MHLYFSNTRKATEVEDGKQQSSRLCCEQRRAAGLTDEVKSGALKI